MTHMRGTSADERAFSFADRQRRPRRSRSAAQGRPQVPWSTRQVVGAADRGAVGRCGRRHRGRRHVRPRRVACAGE